MSWLHGDFFTPPQQLTLIIVGDVNAIVSIALQLGSVEECLDLSFGDGVGQTPRADNELLVHTNLYIVHVIHCTMYMSPVVGLRVHFRGHLVGSLIFSNGLKSRFGMLKC